MGEFVGGDRQHGRINAAAAQVFDQGQTIHVRQAKVHDQQVHFLGFDDGIQVAAIAQRDDPPPGTGQPAHQKGPDQGIVFNENDTCHGGASYVNSTLGVAGWDGP